MRSLLPFAATGALMACQSAPSEPAQPPPSEGRAGLVVLSQTFGEPGVAVSGQVMDYRRQTRSEALHTLAQAEQAWMVSPAPTAGSCRVRRAHGATAAHASIDLLDMGALTVSPPAPLDDQPVRIEPRPLPALDFRVGGVVYDADRPEDLPYLAGGRYRLAAGGVDSGPLHAAVLAPPPVYLREISAQADGLQVRWGEGGPARVFLSKDVGHETLGVDCAGEDGALDVPAVALAALGSGPVQISVQRATRVTAPLVGGGETTVMFVTRDAREHVIADPLETEAPR